MHSVYEFFDVVFNAKEKYIDEFEKAGESRVKEKIITKIVLFMEILHLIK